MTKLEQLKESVREWNETRSIALAFEICASLFNNLNMEKDCKQKEPLIKDTECREAMRLWADRCGVKTVILYGSEFRYGAKSICFGVDFGLEHLKRYTLDELCGEEEE